MALLAAAALVLVLVVAIGVVILPKLRGGGGPGAEDTQTTGPNASGSVKLKNVPRPGYEKLAEDEGVVDPAALVEKPGEPPYKHAGSTVIPACNLMTFADLKKHGLVLNVNPLVPAYKRSYFDGQGKGPMEDGSDLFLPMTPPNSCDMALWPEGMLTISVFQESYTKASALDYEFKDYVKRPAIGGVTVVEKKRGTSVVDKTTRYLTFALRLEKTVAQVQLSVKAGSQLEAQKQAVLKTIAGNLEEQTARPGGVTSISYDSPLITAKPGMACEVLNADDFRTLFRRHSAPFVTEEIGSAVGRTDFSIGTDIRDPNEYAYVDTLCERNTGEGHRADGHRLRLQITSYMAAPAPAHNMKFGGPYDGAQPLSRPVGEEAYCVTKQYARSAGAVVFRKGRFLVTLTMTEPNQQPNRDPAQHCGRLSPIAERVAGRLK
ncbi:hypothetical protein ACTWPT_27620 [Nonomuraea sp. 3N208]|uniref:hypothetical protein n=1 Tax=Nonomuraea sp. 3N208 TaxID=3457421 RepID=UPI003FD465F5